MIKVKTVLAKCCNYLMDSGANVCKCGKTACIISKDFSVINVFVTDRKDITLVECWCEYGGKCSKMNYIMYNKHLKSSKSPNIPASEYRKWMNNLLKFKNRWKSS